MSAAPRAAIEALEPLLADARADREFQSMHLEKTRSEVEALQERFDRAATRVAELEAAIAILHGEQVSEPLAVPESDPVQAAAERAWNDVVQVATQSVPASSAAPREYVCDFCFAAFGTKHGLGAHRSSHMRRDATCPTCGKQLRSGPGFSAHVRSCTGPVDVDEAADMDEPAQPEPDVVVEDTPVEQPGAIERVAQSGRHVPAAEPGVVEICVCGHGRSRHDKAGGCTHELDCVCEGWSTSLRVAS